MSMTSASQRARSTGLRFSLLASLGLLPVACGGAFKGSSGDDGGTSGGGSSAAGETTGGSSGKGGSVSQGGSSSKAGSANGGATSAGTSGGGAGPVTKCTMPSVDKVTGLVGCAEGYSHRPKPVTCQPSVPPVGAGGESSAGGASAAGLPRVADYVPCSDDPAKCSAYEYGFCDNRGEVAAPGCASGCVTDQDCGAGNICLCGHDESPTGGVCRISNCTSDADCKSGYCASYAGFCGDGGFACNSPKDECLSNADCMPGGTCTPDETGRRTCEYAVCGRPFLVAAQPRRAAVVPGDAWLASTAMPRLDHLSLGERNALAEHWTNMGQMEHASIAAFARFSLQLLALGAPPELVDACTRALADETSHTKLCFSLASAYAGSVVGPGPLDVSGSLEMTSLADIVDLVIAEGCFGETGAALEALEAADTATDPVISAAYTQIAADEQRHAELAFQFVRWALQRGGDAVRARVAAAVAAPPALGSAVLAVSIPCLGALLELRANHDLAAAASQS